MCAISICAYIITATGVSVWISLLGGALAVWLIIRFLGQKNSMIDCVHLGECERFKA